MLVVIATADNAILPSAARAQLVAGLACVDFVTESTPGLTSHTALEAEDSQRLQRLIEHVGLRQQAAAAK